MKKGLLLVTSILMMSTLSGCVQPEPTPVEPNLVSISLDDNHGEYAKGDVFIDEQELVITARYDDKSSKKLSVNDVDLSLIRKTTGTIQPIDTAIEYSGAYTLTATYNEITSNEYTFRVLTAHSWVSLLALTGPEEGETGDIVNFVTSYLPLTTSAGINYEVSDQDLASVISSSNNSVQIELLKEGTLTITAYAKGRNGERVSASRSIEIHTKPVPITKMKQTYQDYGYNKDFLYYGRRYYYSYCPTKGEPKVLIIPVWLTDSGSVIDSEKKDNIRDDIRKAYLGTKEETGWHSVTSYYEEESGGILHLTGTVTDWYNSDYSISDISNNGNTTNTILSKGVKNYFDNHRNDPKTNYDTDGDGFLDAVILIYAAPDNQQQGYSGRSNLWAYTSWTLDSPNTTNPTANVLFWCSYDFLYGDQITAEERTGARYHHGDTSNCTIDAHTFIHEMGHVLGLDDYYDYGGNVSAAGSFSMQDYNVGGHDAFSVMAYGWAGAYIPTETVNIRLKSFQEHKEVILLTPQWNDFDSPFDEYLLLELYTPTGLNYLDSHYQYSGGYPRGTTEVGIRLWHVDARLVKSNGNTVNPIFYNNVEVGQITTAFNNTSNGSRASSYGKEYNLLELIRNDENQTYNSSKQFSGEDLFKARDSFTMERFNSQFVKDAKLNSDKALGWSFTVNSIHVGVETYANITVTKL